MRHCYRCKSDLDDTKFYSNAGPNAWCMKCIQKNILRRSSVKKAVFRAEQAEREQDAIRHVVKQFQKDGQPFVYIIEGASRYKIGHSKNVDKRMRQLNTSTCQSHRLRAVIPGGSELEQILHTKFKDLRVNREWFLRSPKIIEFVHGLSGSLIFLPEYIKQEAPTPLDVSSAS